MTSPTEAPGAERPGDGAAVLLLQVPRLEVFVDGYNVTRGGQGRPALALAEQIADERIVELVAATEAPVMVVFSDRQVAWQTRRLGADVVGSDVFVAAVG